MYYLPVIVPCWGQSRGQKLSHINERHSWGTCVISLERNPTGFLAVGLQPPLLLTFLLTLTGLAVLIKTPFNQTYIFPGPILAPCVRLARLSVHMPRWWPYPQSLLDGGARQLPGRTLHTCSGVRLGQHTASSERLRPVVATLGPFLGSRIPA